MKTNPTTIHKPASIGNTIVNGNVWNACVTQSFEDKYQAQLCVANEAEFACLCEAAKRTAKDNASKPVETMARELYFDHMIRHEMGKVNPHLATCKTDNRLWNYLIETGKYPPQVA